MVEYAHLAHSISNPQIKHWIGKDKRYLCIRACLTTKSKIAKRLKDVNCQNCKKILKRR